MTTPHTVLELRVTKKGNERVRYAECPDHGKLVNGAWKGKRTTDFRAQQVDINGIRWDVWRCNGAEGHLFNSVPAIIPSTPAAWKKWEKQQLEAKAVSTRGA